jgi:hypothetical protein
VKHTLPFLLVSRQQVARENNLRESEVCKHEGGIKVMDMLLTWKINPRHIPATHSEKAMPQFSYLYPRNKPSHRHESNRD